MTLSDHILLLARHQSLQGELPDGLQHRKARLTRKLRHLPQQALLDKTLQSSKEVQLPRRVGHRVGRLQGAATGKDR